MSELKPVRNDVYGEIEQAALEGAKAVRRFLTYQGSDTSYFQRARIGIGAVGSYVRLASTETNREALRLAAGRIDIAELPERTE